MDTEVLFVIQNFPQISDSYSAWPLLRHASGWDWRGPAGTARKNPWRSPIKPCLQRVVA